jgi:hypothetical protein
MGRENLEDYGADFLIMSETRKAALQFRRDRDENAGISARSQQASFALTRLTISDSEPSGRTTRHMMPG